MNEYDLINAYLNLIFDSSPTYFNRLLDGYRGLCQLRKWMQERNIILDAIEEINFEKKLILICLLILLRQDQLTR